MGRSGSRSLMLDLTGIENHMEFYASFEDFNKRSDGNPKVLVLRDPIARAKSGSEMNFTRDYHGSPFLHRVNFESVTHIIKFEQLSEYTDNHIGVDDGEFKKLDFKKKRKKLVDHPVILKKLINWNIKEFDLTQEINLYHKFMSKPVFPIELYKNVVRK